MRRLHTLSDWSDAHPLLSMLVGWIVLAAVILAFVPADPNFYPQHQHMKGAA